jgi:hypothetical protein
MLYPCQAKAQGLSPTHLPMQKLEKITPSKSSALNSPVTISLR